MRNEKPRAYGNDAAMEISHSTRDSHIPTGDHRCVRSEERRINRPQVVYFPSGQLVYFPSGVRNV